MGTGPSTRSLERGLERRGLSPGRCPVAPGHLRPGRGPAAADLWPTGAGRPASTPQHLNALTALMNASPAAARSASAGRRAQRNCPLGLLSSVLPSASLEGVG